MPPDPAILSALISVTFIQPNNKPQYPFPKELHMRRRVVFQALIWLKTHNPLWTGIYIDHDQLDQLLEDGVPSEIVSVARVSHEVDILMQEDTGYVPDLDENEDTVFEDLYPVGDDETTSNHDEGSEGIVLHSSGIVDANRHEILDEDLTEHALANEASPPILSDLSEEKFWVKRGS
ncbi:hypothetical protein IW261DRAFT_1566971 [Armillaria novae-zelandiae]|uniref:DUF6570 domain-containing protein n=1 Tax=Armillaria novae-zelandiae TaxID=153914 RepID=A0AA39UF22_9AGAR|nr:hypothetical protein IW261DRAFT_1566971 [Armillaria novae-zelandiae]